LPKKNIIILSDREIKKKFTELPKDIFQAQVYVKSITLTRFIIRQFEKEKTKLDFSKFPTFPDNTKKFQDTLLYKRHTNKFDSKYILNEADTKIMQQRFKAIMKTYTKPKVTLIADDDPNYIKLNPNNNLYRVIPETTMRDIDRAFSIEKGDCEFTVKNWKEIPKTNLDMDKNDLQRINVRITSEISKRLKFVHYVFFCYVCKAMTEASINDIRSNNYKCNCQNIIDIGNGKTKVCNTLISVPEKTSNSKLIYSYQAEHITKTGDIENIVIDTYEKLDNLDYEMCGVIDNDRDVAIFFCVTHKRIPFPKIDFSSIIKENEPARSVDDTHNFIEDIIAFTDKQIKDISGYPIFGMMDIKLAMIFQKFNQIMNPHELNKHIFLSGYPGTGKTYLFSLYGKFFFHMKYKMSDSNSISLPALRGSSTSNRGDVRGNKNMPGLFGLYNCIYIDEMKSNPELLKFLKTFLLSPTYSNNKADGDKIDHTRISQVCIAENPDMKHLNDYRKAVKKQYDSYSIIKDSDDENDEILEWDSKWDLFQPLILYENKNLKRAIRYVRTNYENVQQDWIDGTELATNDRFAFKFNIGDNVFDTSLFVDGAIDKKEKNDFVNKQDLLNAEYKLVTDNIDEMFMLFNQFNSTKDNFKIKNISLEKRKESFKFLKEGMVKLFNVYKVGGNNRFAQILVDVAEMSKTLNKRLEYNQVDLDMVERFIIMRNRVNAVSDMKSLNIEDSTDLFRIKHLSHLQFDPNYKIPPLSIQKVKPENKESTIIKENINADDEDNKDSIFDTAD